jgi:hypothetical protein
MCDDPTPVCPQCGPMDPDEATLSLNTCPECGSPLYWQDTLPVTTEQQPFSPPGRYYVLSHNGAAFVITRPDGTIVALFHDDALDNAQTVTQLLNMAFAEGKAHSENGENDE